jgi:hypothetical protein
MVVLAHCVRPHSACEAPSTGVVGDAPFVGGLAEQVHDVAGAEAYGRRCSK